MSRLEEGKRSMQSAFDTRAANFSPEQTSALAVAYQLAIKSFPPEKRLPTGTKSKLAKVVVNLGRERARQHLDLDPGEISAKAAAYVSQLRALSLLD